MKIYGFVAVVENLDVEDSDQIELLYTDEFVIVPSHVEGVTSLEVEIEAESGEQAVQALMDHLSNVPDVRLVRIDQDLVNTSEIASRLAVSRETPRTWIAQSPTGVPFPAHFAMVGSPGKPQKLWRWADVYAWAHTLNNGQLDDLATPLDSDTVTWINGHLLPQAHHASDWALVVLSAHRPSPTAAGFGAMSNARKTISAVFESRRQQMWAVTETGDRFGIEAGAWVGELRP